MGIILIGNRRLISPVNIPDLLNKRVLCATDIALHIEKLVLRIGKILELKTFFHQKRPAVQFPPYIGEGPYGKEATEAKLLRIPVTDREVLMGFRWKKTFFPQSGIIAHNDIRRYLFSNIQISLKHTRIR